MGRIRSPRELRPPKDQPFYHLLAENADQGYIAYVSQQNLLRDEEMGEVDHPAVPTMFDGFDGERYRLPSGAQELNARLVDTRRPLP